MENNNSNIDIIERLTRIETKVDTFQNDIKAFENLGNDNKGRIISLEGKVLSQQRDIEDLKSRNQWTVRTLIGTVITSIGALVLCFIKIGLGI